MDYVVYSNRGNSLLSVLSLFQILKGQVSVDIHGL